MCVLYITTCLNAADIIYIHILLSHVLGLVLILIELAALKGNRQSQGLKGGRKRGPCPGLRG